MPDIPQYVATQEIAPTNVAESAAVQRGRRAGVLGNEQAQSIRQSGREIQQGLETLGGVIDKHAKMQDIITGVHDLSAISKDSRSVFEDYLRNADPQDPHPYLKFEQEWLQPRLKELEAGRQTEEGKLWAAEHSASFTTEYRKIGIAADMNRQDMLAKGLLNQTVNNLSTAASQMPSSTLQQLGTLPKTVDAIFSNVPNISPQEKQKLITETVTEKGKAIVLGGGIAAAQQGQEALKAWWKPEFQKYISGSELSQLQNHSINADKAREDEKMRKTTFDQHQQRLDAEKEVTTLLSRTIDQNGKMTVPQGGYQELQRISLLPGVDHQMILAAQSDFKQIEERTKNGVEARTDPETYQTLWSRAYNGLTSTEVFNAHAAGKISDHDATMFHQTIADARDRNTPERVQQKQQFDQWIKNYAEPYIMRSTMALGGPKDPWESQRFMEFEQDKWQQYQQGLAGGKTPYELLRPGQAGFIGGDISRYQVRMTDKMRELKGRATDQGIPPLPPTIPVAPRKAGESAADYLKRTQ